MPHINGNPEQKDSVYLDQQNGFEVKEKKKKRYRQILYNDEGVSSREYKSCQHTQENTKCVYIPK